MALVDAVAARVDVDVRPKPYNEVCVRLSDAVRIAVISNFVAGPLDESRANRLAISAVCIVGVGIGPVVLKLDAIRCRVVLRTDCRLLLLRDRA